MAKFHRVEFQVALFTLIRLVTNTTIRMVNPFLLVFGRGLGVDLASMSLAVSGAALAGALGPFLAQFADRRGRKAGMLIGMVIYAVGTALVAVQPSFAALVVTLLLANLGNNIFLPSVQAYVGDAVPFNKRGLVLAVLEVSWALAFIVGIPAVGFLIERMGWQSPFVMLAVLGAVSVAAIGWLVPADPPAVFLHPDEKSHLAQVFSSGPAVAGMLLGLGLLSANGLVTVVYGAWMEQAFGLKIAALGAASAVIGFSELGAEVLVGGAVDRVGKRRSIVIGLCANILLVFCLPLAGSSLTGALVWLFLFYFSFEVAVVATLPLMTEVLPAARATLMSTFFAATSVGFGLGAALAPVFYTRWGFGANTLAAAAVDVLALAALWRIRLPRRNSPSG